MMLKYRKVFIGLSISFTLCLVTIILLWLTDFFLEKKMKEAIFKLQGSFSSLEVSLLSRSITIEKLSWISRTSDTDSSAHKIYADLIELSGIHILPFILNKKVIVNFLSIDSANIVFVKDLKLSTDIASNNLFESVVLKDISLQRFNLVVRRDTTVLLSGSLHADISDFRIKRDSIQRLTYSFEEVTVRATSIALQDERGLYTTNIRQVYLNSLQDQVYIDSIELIPRHAKYDFAWKAGKQVACIKLSIPKIEIYKLDYRALLRKQIIADAFHIKSFDLEAFKDKRVPFSQSATIPLPMHYFNRLKWKIKIDTVSFGLSQINTETYPEKGIAPALITFNDVSGLLLNLDNIQEKEAIDYATLRASGLLMNKGRIEATFQFPQDGSPVYHAKGFIRDFDLVVLNSALQNAVNIKLRSGYLNLMNFNFTYTDFGSRGSLDMAYQDLRISSLDKNKSSTNEIKTALIYLLVQKNKGIESKFSARIGTIDVKRDRKKYIFNLWLISILDGMRSSFSGGDNPKNQAKD